MKLTPPLTGEETTAQVIAKYENLLFEIEAKLRGHYNFCLTDFYRAYAPDFVAGRTAQAKLTLETLGIVP